MDINTAEPIEPAIWRRVEPIALPDAISLAGKLFTPQVVTVINTNDIPNILKPYIIVKYITGVFSPKNENDKVPKPKNINPGIITFLAPCLSKALPAIGLNIDINNEPGSISNPVAKAEYPLIDCIYNESNIDEDVKAEYIIVISIILTKNVLLLNTLKFNKGSSNFNCLIVNIINDIIPTIIGK